VENWAPQYTTLGTDKGFRNEQDLTDYLAATVSDLLNEQLQWDNFIRGPNGTYYGVGVDIKIRKLDEGEADYMAALDEKGVIPKGSGVSRHQLLDEMYDLTREIDFLEGARANADSETEYNELDHRCNEASTQLAVVRSKLHEYDLARQKNQEEANNPPDEATMKQRAETIRQLERKHDGIAEAIAPDTDLRLTPDPEDGNALTAGNLGTPPLGERSE
jgi:hypothetical protein